MSSTRRNFIGAASTATAGALIGNAAAGSASKKTIKTKRPPLYRIGVLTCHPSHHHMPNIYGPIIQGVSKGGKGPTLMTGMELTHMWDHDPKRVESFCEIFGTQPVKNYNDMVDKVDAIMLTDLRAGDYFHLLSQPYLEAGIPVFYNRCFTPRVSTAKKTVEIAEKQGTPIIVASAWEFTKEAYTLQQKVKEMGPKISGVTAYNSSSEITHDVHGLWLLLAAVGGGIESVAVERTVKDVYSRGTDAWTIKFKPRGDNPVFFGSIYNRGGFGSNASVRINFDKLSFEQSLWYLGNNELRRQYYFVPPLLAFQRIIDGKGMEQSYDHIVEKTAAFLAGFKSHLDLGGKPALLSELDDDFYVSSDPNPLKLPDSMFK